jgi:homoserine kinase type II
MAVFTKVSKENIENFIKNYSIGNLVSFEGIVEGIENTNYKITTSNHHYILTIFEKRVNPEELPFFMSLQKELVAHGFDCPLPIENNKGSIINTIQNKSAVIISFLEGKQLQLILPNHCKEIGSMIARFTNITKTSKLKRKNGLNLQTWEAIVNKCKESKDTSYDHYFNKLEHELIFLKKNWPTDLPTAIIHADLFQDNIFFIKDKISGVIDFYFSCNDILAYDLAIAVNAWCFEDDLSFNNKKFDQLIKGYCSLRNLSKNELFFLPLLCQAAAMRFLLTRLYDWVHTPKNATVVPKNPKEYIIKLRHYRKIVINQNFDENI